VCAVKAGPVVTECTTAPITNNETVVVRIALADDAADIAEVVVRSWQEAYRGLLPQGFLDSLDPAARTQGLRQAIENQRPPADAFIVLTDRARVVGFAIISASRDQDNPAAAVGELCSIYLHPDTWGRGLGGLLLDRAVALLTDAGNRAATLWVLAENTRAIRFYESAGWRLDGAVKQVKLADALVTEVRYRITL
jgi:ribosomal protein S18 acetylase RimI-like enzyme